MRLHTNPKTGEVMTLNLNSQEMPNFLKSSHGQVFQFVAKQRSNTKKRHLMPMSESTLDVFNSAPVNSVRSNASSFFRSSQNSFSNSFGQSSTTIKNMLKDDTPNLRMSRGLYNNKIFGVKKEVQVPEESTLCYKNSININLRGSFAKPSEFSKLEGDLNHSRILMRQKPPSSPHTLTNSRFGTSSFGKSTVSYKLGQSKVSTLSFTAPQLQKVNKFRSIIEDYQNLYQKQSELDTQTLKNTMNHILAYETILNQVKKNKKPKKYLSGRA